MADIFDVVADSTRRDILAVLLEREQSDPASNGEISVS
jgi:predicted transcriptional regulator